MNFKEYLKQKTIEKQRLVEINYEDCVCVFRHKLEHYITIILNIENERFYYHSKPGTKLFYTEKDRVSCFRLSDEFYNQEIGILE